MTIVGIDPHPGHHTAALLDSAGVLQETRTFPNTPDGLAACGAWLAEAAPSLLAVEGPTQPFFVSWALHLQDVGYALVPVPPQLVAAARRRHGRGKSDPRDAVHIARAVLAEPDLPRLTLPAWLLPLRELVRTRAVLATQLKAQRMRVTKAKDPVVREALAQLVHCLQEQVQRLERDLTRRVQALAPRLLALVGVGPVVAGTLLAEIGDPRRFRRADAFALYCGAAPLLWQSGAQRVVRVNPRGNRRLNWALHIIALNRLRLDPTTRAFFERKRAQGQSQRAALRTLKTHLARHLFRQLPHLLAQEDPAPLPRPA